MPADVNPHCFPTTQWIYIIVEIAPLDDWKSGVHKVSSFQCPIKYPVCAYYVKYGILALSFMYIHAKLHPLWMIL